jgi:hypothetical protein
VGAGEVVRKRLLPAISALEEQGVHFEKSQCVVWSQKAL